MQIAVKDLLPNPYRQIDKYPISTEKVEHLKRSIEQTGYWDNIPVRRAGKKYEIPYGHHRLQALKELGITEIEAPVKAIDNATMLLMMAQENLDVYVSNPKIINETVQVAKKFIDDELAKFETWEAFHTSATYSKGLFDTERSFQTAKGMGAGRHAICAFLGGNWKPHLVETALKVMSDDRIDREAAEMMPSSGTARAFVQQVTKFKIPKEEQKQLAARVVESSEGKGFASIAKAVENNVVESVKRRSQDQIKDVSPLVVSDGIDQIMRVAQRRAASLVPSIRRVSSEMQEFIDYLRDNKIDGFAGPEQLRISVELKQIRSTIDRLASIIGDDEGEEEDEYTVDTF